MSLTDPEHELLVNAGTTANPTIRRQAVAVLLRQPESSRDEAANLLGQGFIAATQPSFHLIPKGDTMVTEADFDGAYQRLAEFTNGFTDISAATFTAALTQAPETLAPLRMILGFTYNELAWAMNLVQPGSRTSGGSLKIFERSSATEEVTAKRIKLINTLVDTVFAVMDRSILQVPKSASAFFHSKLDKRDTLQGWKTVAISSEGVPYSALLYQRYIRGIWRQVQDAYSEVKGDKLLEQPIADLFNSYDIPHHHSGSGAHGAARTADLFGLSPGPDFLLPDDSPTVIIESKVAEDGGTARDKAARIKNTAEAAKDRGLLPCAVVDGKGWSERP